MCCTVEGCVIWTCDTDIRTHVKKGSVTFTIATRSVNDIRRMKGTNSYIVGGHKIEHLKWELSFCHISINPVRSIEVVDAHMFVHIGKSFFFNRMFCGALQPLRTFIKLIRHIFEIFIIDFSLIVKKFEVGDDCGMSGVCCFLQWINLLFYIIQVFT